MHRKARSIVGRSISATVVVRSNIILATKVLADAPLPFGGRPRHEINSAHSRANGALIQRAV